MVRYKKGLPLVVPHHERCFIFANGSFPNPSAFPHQAKYLSPSPAGRGVGVRVRLSTDAQIHPQSMRFETSKQGLFGTLRAYPHPPLRATFSRCEKGIKSVFQEVFAFRRQPPATFPLLAFPACRSARAGGGKPHPNPPPHKTHTSCAIDATDPAAPSPHPA